MELPDIVKEKLIELDDQNNQLRAEITKLRATIANKDEILNELEEENVQLRKANQKDSLESSKCAYLEQTITNLKVTLDEKTRDSCKLAEQIETLTASLTAAHDEIDELRRARTPMSPEPSVISEPSNSAEMMRLQEERDDAIFELQRANHRISALESERDDLTERAEAANAEAREMARHLKEHREQLHEMEAELASSRNNLNIANRGNSMFAEFAEERVRLEADMKLLFSKYEAVRKQNYQLSNELDEARLLALRRTRNEATVRCRCHELSPELTQLRGRVQTLEARLAQARNELIDIARTTKGIDPRLKSFYRALKLEMESLREERNRFRDERDKLVDEKAALSARAANAERQAEYANDDVESLKLQLAMLKEREGKKDAAKVSELINGINNDEDRLSSLLHAVKSTPAPHGKPVIQTPLAVPCIPETSQSARFASNTPMSDLHCSFNSTFDVSEAIPSEVRPKRLRFADTNQNDEEDTQRRESISASELRRIARKQARRARSKVLPVAEPLFKVMAKISNPPTMPTNQGVLVKSALESIMSCSSQTEGSQSEIEGSLMDSSAFVVGNEQSVRRCTASPSKDDVSVCDQKKLPKISDSSQNVETGVLLPLSSIPVKDAEAEMNVSIKRHSMLDSAKDFNRTALEDVPEEKENDMSSKSSEGV